MEQLFAEALRSADPYVAVRRKGDYLRALAASTGRRNITVVGFGKAACRMAKGVVDSVGDLVVAGLLITCYGHGDDVTGGAIRVIEAGHPLPDLNGLQGTRELMDLVRPLGQDSLVVTLISGGGSALFVAPAPGVTLEQKQRATRLLLEAGADINELNCVRKHLSQVKGGRLAELVAPARCVSLILSDVIGDRLDVIASGPTAPDGTTFAEALEVLERYRIHDRVDSAVLDHLRRGIQGLVPETLKAGHPALGAMENLIVGSNRQAVEAVARAAAEAGYRTEIISRELSGEASTAGRRLARQAVTARAGGARRLCLIAGGETTVTVAGSGVGGRNQELALAAALELAGTEGVTLLSAGTDGSDGPTGAAGAVVDGTTVPLALGAGADPVSYLGNNDSHSFFAARGGLVVTGPTGTNVMDLQIVLIS